ncbi:MAG: hypothetical protein HYZ45_05870 [Burkholderiales bacterium]|nr:hypothetical protein [Burkholderiales bacterium]
MKLEARPHNTRFFLGLFAGLLLSLLFATTPFAQEREFHPKTKAAIMTTAIYPNILINGQRRFLAANAQIRNLDNTIVTPNSIIDGNYPIRYLENDSGEIYRVWLLTADEAAAAHATMGQGPQPDIIRIR